LSVVVNLTHERRAASGAAAAIVDAFRRVDPSIPVTVSALSDRRRADLAAITLQTVLIGGLAVFTLALAVMGIFALVAQLGADRSREFGIRSALGASASSLVGLLMRTVLASTVAGVLFGLVLTWTAARLLKRFLFETNAFDSGLWLAALSVFVGVSALAAWLPARQAAKCDPSALLRGE
jgi:ABC-type antimicrobial peptide transport system permease subunit